MQKRTFKEKLMALFKRDFGCARELFFVGSKLTPKCKEQCPECKIVYEKYGK